MAENSTIYTHPQFSLYQAFAYTLILSIEPEAFNYAVLDGMQLMAAGRHVSLTEFTEPAQLKELLASGFKQVITGLPASALTLVPIGLYTNESAKDIARLLDVKPDERAIIQTFDVDNILVYKTSTTLIKLIEKYGLKHSVYNACGWVKAIAASNPPGNNLYINLTGGKADYLYYFLGKLRYYNSFDYKNEAELVYYTTLVSNELDLKPQHTYLVLSGDIAAGDTCINRLGEFYPNVSLNALRIAEMPGELPAHNYLSLTALLLCGSSAEA